MSEQPKNTNNSVSNKSRNLIILIVLVLFGIGVIQYFNNSLQNETITEPVGPVARVNGEEITLEEFETTKEQISANLQNTEDLQQITDEQLESQALSSLIARVLLNQRMESHDIQVTDEEVETRLEALSSNFETEKEFQDQLTEQGITQQQVTEQIRSEMRMRIFLENEFGSEVFEVTDEEVQKYYEENIAVMENPRPLEEIEGEVESLVLQQKQQAKLDELLQELQLTSDIEIMI